MKANYFIKIFLIPLMALTLTIFIIATLNACTKKIAEPKVFAFDSWETIAKVAEGGLDNLLETYKPIGGTFIIQDLDNDTEEAAKTRKINIEGVGNFEVRVIAENHDTCENGTTAALTFEFTKVIKNVAFSKPKVISNNWENSELRYFLNNNLLQMFPADLQKVIRTVKKDTCVGDESNEVKTYLEKVFPLSVTEINVSNIDSAKEGFPYKIYEDYPYSPGSDDDPRNKDDESYWLRSPMTQNSINSYLIRVGKSEGFYSQVCYDDVTESKGVVPCFCI